MGEAGLVTREPDPHDGRAILVRLTARSREFAPVAGQVVAELEGRVARRLTPDAYRALRAGLKEVMDL
jgi:DNA-binding MarR family transcriptional regulator